MASRWWVLLLFSVAAFAQTAQITGRVTDRSDALVPGAKVAVINTETGVRREVTTNDPGYYTVPLLTRGIYRIEVEQTGFRKTTLSNLTLDEGNPFAATFLSIWAMSPRAWKSTRPPRCSKPNVPRSRP